ncbi:hypothetical protein E4U53_001988, partial [Claviceps sorghi]
YYVLIAACVLARKAEWIKNACLAAALLLPAVASLHAIVLAAFHRDGAVDLDIYGAFQLCAIGILAAPVTVRLSRTYFYEPGRNTIFLWAGLILAGEPCPLRRTGWLTNIVDADAIIDELFSGCFQAGPETCALARPSDKSASDIRSRLWAWLAHLDAFPMAGLSSSGNALVLSGADIRALLATSAYKPLDAYMPLATLLDAIMQGRDVPLFLSTLESALLGGPLQNSCPLANDTTASATGPDASVAILCGDGEDMTAKNLSWWQSYLDQQMATSSVFGALWSRIRFSCARWPFRANWIYRGPYATPPPTDPGRRPERGRPAAPLLFLTNRLDPVTPLSAARAMARGHPRAGLVVQESMGHCAVASAYSRCTKNIVAEYFATGRVPPGETTCEAECGPWDVGCRARAGAMGAADPWYVRRFPLGI